MCLHPETNVSLCLASPALLLPPVPARSPPVERLPVQLFGTFSGVHSRINIFGSGRPVAHDMHLVPYDSLVCTFRRVC